MHGIVMLTASKQPFNIAIEPETEINREVEQMPKYWFDHIHLMSPDPAKTAEFYQKIFGASLVRVRDLGNGRVSVRVNLGGTDILISPTTGNDAQNGLSHIAFRTDNLVAAVNELKTSGVKFTMDITKAASGSKVSYFLAPESLSVELLEPSS